MRDMTYVENRNRVKRNNWGFRKIGKHNSQN